MKQNSPFLERDRHEQNDSSPPSLIPEHGPSSSDINNYNNQEQLYTPLTSFPPITYTQPSSSSSSHIHHRDNRVSNSSFSSPSSNPSALQDEALSPLHEKESHELDSQQQQQQSSQSADVTLVLDEKPGRMAPVMSLSNEHAIDFVSQAIPG
jgi:hypothetical protein